MNARRYRLHGYFRDPAFAVLTGPLVAAGWTRTDGDDWDLFWAYGGEVPPEVYAQLSPGRYVNHVPGNGALTRKNRLAWELDRAHARAAGHPDAPTERWHPRTFAMPGDREAFFATAEAEPEVRWIRKPAGGASGEGVGLVADAAEAARLGGDWLVQEYLPPHLIDGYKYTLRYYVAITSLMPLAVHVFHDGFTKFASRPFPTDPRDRNRFAHLTNPDVLALDADVPTSSRNLVRADYLARLERDGHDPNQLVHRIDELIAGTVAAARERMLASTTSLTPHHGGCFELMGLDILVDEHITPWLIECNLDPSLDVEADPRERAAREEADVKTRLVADLVALVGLTPPRDTGFRCVFPDVPSPSVWTMLALPRPQERPSPELVPVADATTFEVGDSLAVHTPRGRLHVLNSTAAHVWLALSDGLSIDAIAQEIAEVTGATLVRVTDDVWSLLASWREMGLAAAPDSTPTQPFAARPEARLYVEWNIGRTYELAGTRVHVHASDWNVLHATDPALRHVATAPGPVHHHLTIEPRGAHYVLFADTRLTGPPMRVEALGSVCRSVVLGWALAESEELTAEAVALVTPTGHAALVLGPKRLRSRLLGEWTAAGGAVLADELVIVGGTGVRPLHIGREVPASSTYIHLAGGDDVLLDGSLAAVRYDEVPVQARSSGDHAVAGLLLLTGDSDDDVIRPATPTDALLAVLGARAQAPLSRHVATRLVELVTTAPAWSVSVAGGDEHAVEAAFTALASRPSS